MGSAWPGACALGLALAGAACGAEVNVIGGENQDSPNGAGVGQGGAPSGVTVAAAGVTATTVGVGQGGGVTSAAGGSTASVGAGGSTASVGAGGSTASAGGSSGAGAGSGTGPAGSSDDEGDVTQASSDITSIAVYVGEGMGDFRVQYAEQPFAQVSTAWTNFCLDFDENPATGSSCAMHEGGIEDYLSTWQEGTTPGEFSITLGSNQLDSCTYGSYEPDTMTVRVLVPLTLLGDDGMLRYVAESTFGGSFGANDAVPETGKLDAVQVTTLPPFNGVPACF